MLLIVSNTLLQHQPGGCGHAVRLGRLPVREERGLRRGRRVRQQLRVLLHQHGLSQPRPPATLSTQRSREYKKYLVAQKYLVAKKISSSSKNILWLNVADLFFFDMIPSPAHPLSAWSWAGRSVLSRGESTVRIMSLYKRRGNPKSSQIMTHRATRATLGRDTGNIRCELCQMCVC